MTIKSLQNTVLEQQSHHNSWTLD